MDSAVAEAALASESSKNPSTTLFGPEAGEHLQGSDDQRVVAQTVTTYPLWPGMPIYYSSLLSSHIFLSNLKGARIFVLVILSQMHFQSVVGDRDIWRFWLMAADGAQKHAMLLVMPPPLLQTMSSKKLICDCALSV